MKSYNEITFKYLKKNKKRTILTTIGIILAVSLFSGIGTFFYSLKEGLIENARKNSGNYEVIYSNVKGEKLKELSNNFEILNFGISKVSNDPSFNIEGFDEKYEVYLSYYDSEAFYNTFNGRLIEGVDPKDQDEIIIGKRAEKALDKKIGDYINLKSEGKESRYKIVGYYDDTDEPPSKSYNAMTFINKSNIDKNENYNIYANLKEKKDKRGAGEKVGISIGLKEEDIKFNDSVLRLMLQDKNQLYNDSMYKIMTVILSIIIICTVAVIYNSFNISVAERINQFGILRCLGATPSKIRRLVFKEGFIMGIIAIPIGIVSGYLGIYTTIKLMNKSESFIFNFSKVGFYPQVVVISIILSIITIMLSVMGPARTASKIPPIEAVKNSAKLKKEKFKRRKPRLIKLLFGIEGEVAYKNIISDISHQLKTPLFSLVMFNDLMKEEDVSKEDRKRFLILSDEQLKRMEWLIINLLKIGRLEAGVINFKTSNNSLKLTIDKALTGLLGSSKEKHQNIILKGSDEIYFNHDMEWTAEAISNIVKNSIEHTKEGGTIVIETEETPLSVSIMIIDNGVGIPKELFGRIFERFYKGENSVNPTSIGIGLYLGKYIIESQNGSIRVESEVNRGSKFTITFLKTVI
ncbi:ATP-binding protein [Clostridium algidicarnis]|uniref:ATP-binding protein n=1 Tax=Clostridium algidicarnis TaxID=37659 RepID=UPI0016283625|nr:FtsX-like permease family protein [Clostridium algidicarnis]